MISQAMRNELISAALTAMKNAYAPYSDFYVGAALLCENGKIYTGFNIENAAFTPTVCAERAAFTRALCDGERSFCAIAVCGGKHGQTSDLITTPCGVCRQFMREFCTQDFEIITASSPENYRIYTLREILPDGFGPENL